MNNHIQIENNCYNLKQAATAAGMDARTLRRWLKDRPKRFKFIADGRWIRINKKSFHDYINALWN